MTNFDKFTPKIRYVPTQPPTPMGGDEHISPQREFLSYSDTDYEYILYRTREKDPVILKNRSDFIDRYHREEPSEENNFNLGNDDDYQTLFDDDNLMYDFPDEMDDFFKPGFFFREIASYFNISIFDIFFSENSHINLGLYYFLSWYFYFSEYTWPIVQLYFPFLNYLDLTFTFGWEAFLEHNLFTCFFILYIPIFGYLYLYWFYSSDRQFYAYFNFFRLVTIFFTIFFFCLFFPVNGLSFLLFLPPLAAACFFASFYPYQAQAYSENFYSNFTKFLLPLPVYKETKFLPLYSYKYPYFFDNSTIHIKFSRFTRFPFFKVKKLSAHYKRVRLVSSYPLYSANLSCRSDLPHNFSHLQPTNFSGFLFEHLPLGFGYSAESHVMLEGFEKTSNIEFDNESGLRPDNYTIDFITNELGLSNIRFFLGESYHQSLHYNSIFDGSSDAVTFYTPIAFSRTSRAILGPYYELSLWLTLINPSSDTTRFSTSFSNTSFISPVRYFVRSSFHRSSLSFFNQPFPINFEDHTFVKGVYRIFFHFFYNFLRYFFLRMFGFTNYRFSSSNSPLAVCSDFLYIFSVVYPRPIIFKQLFRFIVFINKNYKSKKLLENQIPVLVATLLQLYGKLCQLELIYTRSIFKVFFPRRLRYVRLCRMKLGYLLKNFS